MKAMAKLFELYQKNETACPSTARPFKPPPGPQSPNIQGPVPGKRQRTRQRKRLPEEALKNIRTRKKRHLSRHRHIACNTINYNENFLQQTIMNETNDNEIIILCKRNTITDTQKELLKKGLSFVPKPKDTNINQLYTDLCQFIQKLRRTFTSHSYQKKRQETKNIDPIQPARKPPKYIETSCGNNNLETFIHRIRLEIINPKKHIQQRKTT